MQKCQLILQRSQSGIRRHQWLGKYWSKWSDALREAGLGANDFKKRTELEIKFPKFADAVRYFGREPSGAELELYWNDQRDAPSYKSIVKRFSSKSELFQSVRAWAEQTEEFRDIADLIPLSVPISTNPKIVTKEGHVYLLSSGSHYKIGRGEDLERRVKQIKVALPDSTVLVHAIRTDDPPGIEAYWHRRFSEKRANGEWFKLTTADVAAFKKRKYQ